MAALLNFIYSSFNNHPYKKAFISNPPGPAIILFSNNTVFPKLSGIAVVKEKNMSNPNSNQENSSSLISTIVENIRSNSFVPSLNIEYDFTDLNDTNHSLYINGNQYNVTDGGKLIASTFSIEIGPEVPKAVTSTEAVKDPFHLWSSDLFDGHLVKKIDLDLVIVDTANHTISTLVEIKRSDKADFDKWKPYQADYNNYAMMLSLSDALGTKFITIHHNEMLNRVIDPTKLVNIYSYIANSSMNWESFRDLQNRLQLSAQKAVDLL
ncbi:hypothetical protein [uncultured Exiguobacterium sp.]|uniref:hypothetical protein n=1 Tax=uncultured Exiguobacterium sp. TaxID=202669 RepID=UPI00374A6FF6